MLNTNVVRLLKAVLVLAALSGARTALAQTAAITQGSLPRDLNSGTFNITVTISNVPQATHDKGLADASDENGNLAARIQVFLTDVASSKRLYYVSEQSQAAADAALPFFVSAASPHTETAVNDASGTTYTYVYFITIQQATAGGLAGKLCTAASGGTASTSCSGITTHVAVDFFLGGQTGSPIAKVDPPFALTQAQFVANEEPTFAGPAPVVGSMKSLSVTWNVKSTITTAGNTQTGSPSSMDIYILDTHENPSSTISLPAKKFNPSATGGSDTAATCTMTVPTADSGVCVTCPNSDPKDTGQYYLDFAGIQATSGFKHSVQATNADGTHHVTDLLNGIRYIVFLEYEPNGLIQTGGEHCLAGRPSPNFTLTELNGEGDATIVDFRCFVATAAYGSPMAPELHYFRKFRSSFLLKHPLGRAFVHYYYEYSPPLADFIFAHPRLRALTRGLLAGPLALLKAADEYY